MGIPATCATGRILSLLEVHRFLWRLVMAVDPMRRFLPGAAEAVVRVRGKEPWRIAGTREDVVARSAGPCSRPPANGALCWGSLPTTATATTPPTEFLPLPSPTCCVGMAESWLEEGLKPLSSGQDLA